MKQSIWKFKHKKKYANIAPIVISDFILFILKSKPLFSFSVSFFDKKTVYIEIANHLKKVLSSISYLTVLVK